MAATESIIMTRHIVQSSACNTTPEFDTGPQQLSGGDKDRILDRFNSVSPKNRAALMPFIDRIRASYLESRDALARNSLAETDAALNGADLIYSGLKAALDEIDANTVISHPARYHALSSEERAMLVHAAEAGDDSISCVAERIRADLERKCAAYAVEVTETTAALHKLAVAADHLREAAQDTIADLTRKLERAHERKHVTRKARKGLNR